MRELTSTELAGYIDHTLLDPAASDDEIRALCEEALRYGFKAVCVRPDKVALAAQVLKGSPVLVASVANFPAGDQPLEAVLAEVGQTLADGAAEIDYVMDLPAALAGEWSSVTAQIAAVAELAHAQGAACKVIIETCLLKSKQKLAACQAAIIARADFVKTSTGYSTGGATTKDVATISQAVGGKIGVKASGGISSREEALDMIAAGAGRIGSSSSVAIVGG